LEDYQKNAAVSADKRMMVFSDQVLVCNRTFFPGNYFMSDRLSKLRKE